MPAAEALALWLLAASSRAGGAGLSGNGSPGPAGAAAADFAPGLIFEDPGPRRPCGQGWSAEFRLDRTRSAKVEIGRLRGLRREHKGEARLWLDGVLLGPLRAEHEGRGWRFPRPLALAPGPHRLEIECGEDRFEMGGLRVWDEGQAFGPKKTSGAPPAAQLVQSPPADCAHLKPNTEWDMRLRRGLLLSDTRGYPAGSGRLAILRRGEKLRWWFKLAPRPAAALDGSQPGLDAVREYPPLLLTYARRDDGLWQLEFGLDQAEWAKALRSKTQGLAYEPKGYRRDRWNPMDLSLCPDGRFRLSLSEGEVTAEFPVGDPAMPLEIRARDLEIRLQAGE